MLCRHHLRETSRPGLSLELPESQEILLELIGLGCLEIAGKKLLQFDALFVDRVPVV